MVPLATEYVELAVHAVAGSVGEHRSGELYVVHCTTVVKPRERFEMLMSLLDPVDPFEIDSKNRPHLYARGFCPDDAYDIFFGDPEYYVDDSEGSADWLMVGSVPGGDVLVVPIAQSEYSGYSKVRPITIFSASLEVQERFLDDKKGGADHD